MGGVGGRNDRLGGSRISTNVNERKGRKELPSCTNKFTELISVSLGSIHTTPRK